MVVDASVADAPPTVPVVPVPDTVAVVVAVLLQVPPGTLALSETVAPEHTDVGPVMVPALGNGFTVTGRVAVADPQLKVEAV